MKIREGEDEGSASVAPEMSTDAESHRQKYHVAWSQMAGSSSSQQLISSMNYGMTQAQHV